MHVEKLIVGAFEVNTYLVWDHPDQGLLIDPGSDPEAILEMISNHKVTVSACLLTHGHVDHIQALADILQVISSAEVGMHPADLEWAFTERAQILPFLEIPRRPPCIHRKLQQGQEWNDTGHICRIMETPGHTPGSVCLHFPDQNILFSGDTLFAGSVGRTDLDGGNSRILTNSLKILAGLPDQTRVYPGHGPSTTIAREKKTNYFMQSLA